MKYCTCDKPEPEEVERGVWECMKCEKEMEYYPDPDLMHDSYIEDIINSQNV